jgi:hypothetical protein
MIWIVGEYAERIDNADELLESFLDSFGEENPQVWVLAEYTWHGPCFGHCASWAMLLLIHLWLLTPVWTGTTAVVDSHCQAVLEAPWRHPRVGPESPWPLHTGASVLLVSPPDWDLIVPSFTCYHLLSRSVIVIRSLTTLIFATVATSTGVYCSPTQPLPR